jgi:hypothetical protein
MLAASAGVATFNNLTINNAGTGYTLYATDGALVAATSSSFTVFGPAAKLVFLAGPTNTATGVMISPSVTVQVQDAGGNPVTGDGSSVTLALGAGSPSATLGGTLMLAASAGVATFNNLTINNAGTGYTLYATDGSLTAATSSPFTVFLPAIQLAFVTQPSSTAAGAPISPAVTVLVEDTLGNVVTSSSATVLLTFQSNPTSATLSGTTSVNAVNGVATFSNLSINNVGTGYTLIALSSGLANSPPSVAFNIALTNHLVFVTQPGGGATGAIWTQQPVVAVENASNAIVSDGSTVYLSISTNPAGGTLSCTGGLSEVAVNGYAYFSGCSINLGSATAYTLTVTSSAGWTAATSSAFYVGGSSQQLVFTTQPGGGAAGAVWSVQPVVAVENASNAVVSDYSTVVYLSIATNPAGGTLSCTGGTSEVAVNGYAYFTGCSINLGSASAYTLYATSNPSWTAATSGGFSVSSTQAAVTIASDTAVGQVTSGFSRATKIVRPGTWITVRFQTSPTLAGRTLGVWIAKKTNGVWGAFSPHASITTNSSGVAYYQYRTTSTVWQSFLVKFAGDSTAGPSSSSGTQVRWL